MPATGCVAYTIAPMAVRLWGRSESSIERSGTRSQTPLSPRQSSVASTTAIRFAFSSAITTYENLIASARASADDTVVLVGVTMSGWSVVDVVDRGNTEPSVGMSFVLVTVVGDVVDDVHAEITSTKTVTAVESRMRQVWLNARGTAIHETSAPLLQAAIRRPSSAPSRRSVITADTVRNP